MRHFMIFWLSCLVSAGVVASGFEAEIGLKQQNDKGKFDRITNIEIEDGQYKEDGAYNTSTPTIRRVASTSDTEELLMLVHLCVAWGGADFKTMMNNKRDARYQLKCEMEQGDSKVESKLYFNDLDRLPAAIQARLVGN